jgi:hypothetical protein
MRQDSLDVLTNLIQKYVRDNVNTHLPAKVVAVTDYGSKQTVDVNIQLSRLYSNGKVLDNKDSIIYGVPVVFPSGGGGLLSFPVAVGDTVLIVFSQRNIEDWLLSDGQREIIPGDSRHYSDSDAIAIPGLYTTQSHLSPNTTDVELKFKNSSIRISPDNVITITNGQSTYVMDGGDVTLTATNINLNGNVTIPTSLTLGGKEINNHTHPITSGSSAPGPTGPNT